jgi:hypothetical protein
VIVEGDQVAARAIRHIEDETGRFTKDCRQGMPVFHKKHFTI